jgi:hypothetical protein
MLSLSAHPVLRKPIKQDAKEKAASVPAGTAIIAAKAPNGVKRNGGMVQDPTIPGVQTVRNTFVNVNRSACAPIIRAPLSINRLMPLPHALACELIHEGYFSESIVGDSA